MMKSKFLLGLRICRRRCLLLFLTAIMGMLNAFAQQAITGTVTDKQGEPLIGANVVIKGTAIGTVTDIDGRYTISAKTGDVLTFSYLGMKSQSVTIGANTKVSLSLEEDTQELTETVVIGYGTAKKADLTGSIGNVSNETILKQPALNAVQSIQGKVAGINIINTDAPGSTPNVVVRGLGTALGGRNPLYIVDGFPVDDIRNINSSDIASMDILKDASSASIYGLRAANGVILVTTKKGQEGKARIGVESYVGIKTVLNKVKMANASQYVQYFNENQQVLKDGGNDNAYFLKDNQPYDTDWYDELLHTGITTNNVVSLSGGSKAVDYYFSYNYYNEGGMLDDQRYDRSTIRSNNVYKFFNDRLKFNQNLSVAFSNENVKPYTAFNEAYRQSPLTPATYENGRYGKPFVNKTTGAMGYEGAAGDEIGLLNSIGNPLFTVANANQKTKTLTLQGGIEGEFKIFDFLKVNSRFGATKYISKNRQFTDIKNAWLNADPRRTEADFNNSKADNPSVVEYANNSLRMEDVDTYRWIWEGFLTFNKSFGNHNIELVAGMSREKTGVGNTTILTAYDVPSKRQYWNIGMASDAYAKDVNQYYYTPRTLASYFGRLQYNYNHKYYVSATIRRDGSSVFSSTGDEWGTFPSFGAGWTISSEDFMKDLDFITYLKLRGTWGKLGNQDVPLNVSQILTSPASENYNYVFGPDQALIYGAAMGTPAVPLSWEVTKEWGIGLDFAFLNDRLSGSLDYYNKMNTNAILDVTPISNSMYEKNFSAHGADVSNRGVEVALNWSDQLVNGLSYEIGANYSYNKNEVQSVVPTYDGATGGDLKDGQITKRLQEGQPIYAWWMYETDGVWQNQAEIDNPANAKAGSPKPGHLRYKDQNQDGIIDERDKKYMGSYIPTSNYGVHIALGYKNIDFSVDGYGVGGNKIYNGLKHGRFDGGEGIAYDTFKNRWTGEGTSNSNPGANRDNYASDYFLEDGKFFRINNITLGYTFNDLVFDGSRLRLYFTAQNPFIITGYSGFSPEISGYSTEAGVSNGDPKGTSGVELSAYPSTRNFLFGVNLSF